MINYVIVALFFSLFIVPAFAQDSNSSSIIQNNPSDITNKSQTDNSVKHHDYIGWGIGIVGMLIAVGIYKKQSKTEKEFRQIQHSIKVNSLKIINFYLESLGKDLGKTASIVQGNIANGNFEISNLKQLLQNNHDKISGMLDILSREVGFVRPYLTVKTFDIINTAAHFIQEYNKYDDLETKFPDPALWLDAFKQDKSRISLGISTIIEELSSDKNNIASSESEKKFQKGLTFDGILYGGLIAVGTTVFATGAALWIASATMIASAVDSGNDSSFSLSLVTVFQELVPVYTISGLILVILGFVIPTIKLR